MAKLLLLASAVENQDEFFASGAFKKNLEPLIFSASPTVFFCEQMKRARVEDDLPPHLSQDQDFDPVVVAKNEDSPVARAAEYAALHVVVCSLTPEELVVLGKVLDKVERSKRLNKSCTLLTLKDVPRGVSSTMRSFLAYKQLAVLVSENPEDHVKCVVFHSGTIDGQFAFDAGPFSETLPDRTLHSVCARVGWNANSACTGVWEGDRPVCL